MVMKKIFEKNFDEEVHSDFLKFGKGEFRDKYLVECKRQKDRWAIKTSHEYANLLVRKCLEESERALSISGVIITTLDLGELGFPIKKKSNFQGIKKLEIDSEIEPARILELMRRFPRVFFGLSFKSDLFELKIKPKSPKSSKPGSGGDKEVKADFCSLKTSRQDIVNELLFDVGDFKEAKVKHTIKVMATIYPRDMAGMKPEEVREKSKRKGVVVRELEVDGVKRISQAEFEA